MTIESIWGDLSAWCEAQRPDLLADLNGPASEEDLAALRDGGLPVPEALLAFLARHDGEAQQEATGLFANGGYLLSATGMLSQRDMLGRALRDLDDDPPESLPALGPVRPQSFNDRWLPIMDMNGDVTWYLDFDPAPGGVVGQVIRVDVENSEWVVCAPSFEAFLRAYLDDLKAGRIFDEDGELRDEQVWPPLARLPALQPEVIDIVQLQALGALGQWELVTELCERMTLAPAQRLRLQALAAMSQCEYDSARQALEELETLGEAGVDDVLLRIEALEGLEQYGAALAELERAIAKQPTAALWVRRAELTLAAAERAPVQGYKAQMKWLAGPAGQQALATARERALADYAAALKLDDRPEWQLASIDLLLDGERWEEGEAAAQSLLAALQVRADRAASDWREQAESALQRARDRGEGEGDDLMQSMDEMLASLGEIFGASDDGAPRKALSDLREVRDTFAELRDDEAQQRAAFEAEPDSLRRRAREVAEQLARQHVDTTERFAPFDAATLDAKARRYYDRARDDLAVLGYIFCADVEPLRNTETSGHRVLMRLMLSPDRRTAAAIWRLGNAFATYEVIELETALADGRILISNNSGSANPFQQPPGIEVLALPLGAAAKVLQAAHDARWSGVAAQLIEDVDAILALQERQRLIKREAARARGWVSDAELRGLLGGSYRELQAAVREELAALL